ncbi:MAG TPA: HD-GYP domain-containing protein [Acidimicrobiales bacterium]|nr:HD-GYP domain-containing protein [Acidimicrobiales bacterium]
MVRLLALAIPVATSVASAAVLSRLITRPSGLLPVMGWWSIIVATSTTALVAVDRAARRLLPLAALLRLSMVFPDRAPSRFGIAFRAGTTRNLKEQLAAARERGIDDEPTRSAQRLLTLVGALNRHDRATHGHSERVRAFNDLIAEGLRLPEADRDRLRWAALMHDVGKVEVPARVLNKPSVPSPDEWETLRSHPEAGARIAAPLRSWLGPWSLAIEEHHERWDGTGYPRGLAGQEISLARRIVAVADVLDVLTTQRPYRRPVSAQAARAELARHAGSQFGPEVVRALLNVSLGKLRAAMGPVSWLAQLPFLNSVPRLEGAVAAAGRSAMTAAGTATGVGAFAVMGVYGSELNQWHRLGDRRLGVQNHPDQARPEHCCFELAQRQLGRSGVRLGWALSQAEGVSRGGGTARNEQARPGRRTLSRQIAGANTVCDDKARRRGRRGRHSDPSLRQPRNG